MALSVCAVEDRHSQRGVSLLTAGNQGVRHEQNASARRLRQPDRPRAGRLRPGVIAVSRLRSRKQRRDGGRLDRGACGAGPDASRATGENSRTGMAGAVRHSKKRADRDRTAGLTNDDLIGSLSASYGPPVLKSAIVRTDIPTTALDDGTVIAQW